MKSLCETCKDISCLAYETNTNKECLDYEKMTNADRIRAMTDEELADFIAEQRFLTINPIADKLGIDVTLQFIDCRKNTLDWLKQEVEE